MNLDDLVTAFSEEDIQNNIKVDTDGDDLDDPINDPAPEPSIDNDDPEPIPDDPEIVIDEEAVRYFNFLKENNVLSTNEDFEFSGNPEDIETALNQTKNNLIKEAQTKLWEALPERFRPLLEYGLKGGQSLEDFLQAHQEIDFENVDLEDPISQRMIVKQQWKLTSNYSDEKIDRLIDKLEKTGALKESAEEAITEIAEDQRNKQIRLLQEAEAQTTANKQAAEAERRQLEQEIETTFQDSTRKNRVKAFMLAPVKQNNEYTSEFNLALDSIMDNPKHLIQLADILTDYDKSNGFNFERLKKQFKSETAKSFRDMFDSKLRNPTSQKSTKPSGNDDFDWGKWIQE